MLKLDKKISDKYTLTDKAKFQRFEHVQLGHIDLSKLSEPLAKKLVITGHLAVLVPKPEKKQAEKSAKKDSA